MIGEPPLLQPESGGGTDAAEDADNIITVMSGDEIAQLPNPNAAQALTRPAWRDRRR